MTLSRILTPFVVLLICIAQVIMCAGLPLAQTIIIATTTGVVYFIGFFMSYLDKEEKKLTT